ncbi:MAG: hormogonium polysaccharide biosynthesis glycosyltransferase HpsE [Microcoleaceae cyanobacterium]
MINFTVVICTYNGLTRLPQLLDQLISQVVPPNFSWEILIVDNNSTDKTASLINQYQSQWSHIVPIHYAFESQQGIAYARKRGIKQANGELIGFLDDDNIPTQTWVTDAYHFAQSHPNMGACNGHIEGQYEVKPPPNFERISCFLAVVNRGEKSFRYDLLERWLMPPGAGLVIRKKAWLTSVPAQLIFTGVQAKSLANKGEDIEALSYMRQKGWEIWHNCALKIYHQIPVERLQKPYLVKLCRSIGLSRYPTRMLQYSVFEKPWFSIVHFFYDLYKLVTHRLKYSTTLDSDVVAQCEQAFLVCSLLSPFYYWNQKLLGLIQKTIFYTKRRLSLKVIK